MFPRMLQRTGCPTSGVPQHASNHWMSRRIQAFYATETGDQGHDKRNTRMLNYYSYSICHGHNFYVPQYRSFVVLRLQTVRLMQNAQNRHVPFPSHMEQTVMSILSRSKVHSPRPEILAAITFQQHGTTKNDHRSCKYHFFKQKATPALHKSDSLTTLSAIFQCACPLRPQHTHIKQTWRFELVKVKALKYKSSYPTGVNLLLSSYTRTNLANLL
jgi:hypothetical protein